jgi:hypothetical protein
VTLPSDQRRALEMLAGSPNGCTEATLRAHGFGVGLLAGLVRAKLAIAKPEHVKAGGRTVSFVRIEITEAGRRALAGKKAALPARRAPVAPPRAPDTLAAYRRPGIECARYLRSRCHLFMTV